MQHDSSLRENINRLDRARTSDLWDWRMLPQPLACRRGVWFGSRTGELSAGKKAPPSSSTLPCNPPFDSSLEGRPHRIKTSTPHPRTEEDHSFHACTVFAVFTDGGTVSEQLSCCSKRPQRLVNVPQWTANMCCTFTSV